MIYLRFITEKWSLESALIRFGTRSWASHVEFVRVQDAQFLKVRNVPVLASPSKPIDTLGSRVEGGVQIRPYDYCKPTAEVWFTAANIGQAYEALMTKLGARYNWLDILGITLAKDWHADGQFICSEAVAWAFEQTPMPLLSPRTETWRLTPRDLLLSDKLREVRRVI